MQTHSSQGWTRSLADWAAEYERWLNLAALPLWWSLGVDHDGSGFQEAIQLDGAPAPGNRRMRVQARQAHVYGRAGLANWRGPWREAVHKGLSFLEAAYRRPDGLYRTAVSAAGEPLDDTAVLYDQAFVLLALATATKAGVIEGGAARARALLAAVDHGFAHERGYREAAAEVFQSNPHMHLLEAMLAWMDADDAEVWRRTASDIVALCLDRFIDPEGGYLREFFDADWRPAPSPSGEVVEPGHQFEWAWLLARWSVAADQPDALAAARRLYAAGMRGVDRQRGVAIDELTPALAPARRTARLWPQTEWLKAATLLALRTSEPRFEIEAGEAAAALWRYLDIDQTGLYRDKMDVLGGFIVEPAPASSLYHIQGAIEALRPWRVA